eukprot:764889-Hanusia_phi.AAC.1
MLCWFLTWLPQGGRDVRDVGLADKVEKLRSDLSSLDEELNIRFHREEEKTDQLEKLILELQSSDLQLKEDLLQEKSRNSSDVLSLREDFEQKSAHQSQELEDLRLHVSCPCPCPCPGSCPSSLSLLSTLSLPPLSLTSCSPL